MDIGLKPKWALFQNLFDCVMHVIDIHLTCEVKVKLKINTYKIIYTERWLQCFTEHCWYGCHALLPLNITYYLLTVIIWYFDSTWKHLKAATDQITPDTSIRCRLCGLSTKIGFDFYYKDVNQGAKQSGSNQLAHLTAGPQVPERELLHVFV